MICWAHGTWLRALAMFCTPHICLHASLQPQHIGALLDIHPKALIELCPTLVPTNVITTCGKKYLPNINQFMFYERNSDPLYYSIYKKVDGILNQPAFNPYRFAKHKKPGLRVVQLCQKFSSWHMTWQPTWPPSSFVSSCSILSSRFLAMAGNSQPTSNC